MKLKVIRPFSDADKGVVLNKGDSFECGQGMADFLTGNGYAEEVKKKAPAKKAQKDE